MNWNDKTIVDLSREFLNSNGAEKHTDVAVPLPVTSQLKTYTDCADSWEALMTNLNICSQKGLVERFDSTIGAGTVHYALRRRISAHTNSGNGCKDPCSQG